MLAGARTLLEIASGSGEHAVYFAAALPQLRWQPSDVDASARASIVAHTDTAGLPNVAAPISLDAAAQDWPGAAAYYDAILAINMVHIAPWAASVGLFAGAAARLDAGAPLILYGPFVEDDVPTAPSNVDFDTSLRSRDAGWGLRHVSALDALAAAHGMQRCKRAAMPANNLLLAWAR